MDDIQLRPLPDDLDWLIELGVIAACVILAWLLMFWVLERAKGDSTAFAAAVSTGTLFGYGIFRSL